jgi:hypothetical protein
MSLPPEMLQQRYSAIELAYSERRWPEVESLSQALLAELTPNPADPLQLRLVLLLGHTRLYGLADPSGAHHYYASVLEHCEEPTLRDIAQQGLEQCAQQTDPPPSQAAPAPTSAEPAAPWLVGDEQAQPSGANPEAAEASATPSADATPWLSAQEDPVSLQPQVGPHDPPPENGVNPVESRAPLAPEQPADTILAAIAEPSFSSPSEPAGVLVPEIVDEPEQIAVAQADPLLRQELALEELTPPEPSSASTLPDPEELSAEQLDDLARGLLRIRVS